MKEGDGSRTREQLPLDGAKHSPLTARAEEEVYIVREVLEEHLKVFFDDKVPLTSVTEPTQHAE